MIHLYFFTIIGMLIFPRFYLVNKDVNSTRLNENYVQLDDDNDSTNSSEIKTFEKNKVFTSIKEALFNMLIFLTSSNNPDSKI